MKQYRIFHITSLRKAEKLLSSKDIVLVVKAFDNIRFAFGPSPGLKCQMVRAMASLTVAAPKRETDPKKRIVITGMGLVSVFGSDIDTFYNKLLEGQSGISLINRFDASDFSVRFAGQIHDFSSEGYIDGKNDRRLDDAWRYCLVAGRRALDYANLGKEALDTVSNATSLLVLRIRTMAAF